MKRAIVTGGSGFIGYHLAEYLSSQPDMEVTVIDNHARGIPDDMFKALIARDNVRFLNADMTKKDFYAELYGYYDHVYHLAAINGTKNFYERPYEVLRANILTLMNMLEFCTPENCGAFLYSSLAVNPRDFVQIPIRPEITSKFGIIWKKGVFTPERTMKFIEFVRKHPAHTWLKEY